mgnify:CR=1 FL=1
MNKEMRPEDLEIEEYKKRAQDILGAQYDLRDGDQMVQARKHLEKLYHVYMGIEMPIVYQRSLNSFDLLFKLEDDELDFFENKSIHEILDHPDLEVSHLTTLRDHGQLLREYGECTRKITRSPIWEHQRRVGAVIYNLACAKANSRFKVHIPDNMSVEAIKSNLENMLNKDYVVPSLQQVLAEGTGMYSRYGS